MQPLGFGARESNTMVSNTMKSQIQLTATAVFAMAVCSASYAATDRSGAQDNLSPSQRRVALARQALAKNPDRHETYYALAMALAERARETADPEYYDQAEEAIKKTLQKSPDDLQAKKCLVWIHLGRHEFARALELAQQLNERAPDDVLIYGLLTDAHVELGNYDDAEAACQWMLDLRPGNIPGLTRAAYLRELFGDVDGAIDLMMKAYNATPPIEIEHRAWMLTHVGHLFLTVGKLEDAERWLGEALKLVPDYHYAIAAQAELRSAQGQLEEAVELSRRHYELAPHPENLYLLGKALQRCGRDAEAAQAFEEFEEAALAESDNVDNANRELIDYYVGEGEDAVAALRIAELEIARRRDVFTRDAYAWALRANGQVNKAREEIEAALEVGIQDARLLFHAGSICADLGDIKAAGDYFRKAIDLNRPSEWAIAATNALAASPSPP